MNRRLAPILFFLLFLTLPHAVAAQQFQSLLVRLGAGFSDDFGGDIEEPASGLTHPATAESIFGYIGVQYTYRGGGAGLFLSADFSQTSIDLEDVFGTSAQNSDRRTEILHVDGGFNRYFPSASGEFQPYIGSGLGFSRIDIEALGETDALTVFLDGGFEQRITKRFGVGLGARIRWLSDVHIKSFDDKPLLIEVFFGTIFTLRR